MKQTVLLFARARDLAGAEKIVLELPTGATIADLKRILLECSPGLKPIAESLLIAMNNSYVAGEMPISPGVEIACFPPVSGG